MLSRIMFLLSFLVLGGCVKVPENIKPVDNFDSQRYLGKWYEIARLDHSFERGLSQVSAQYAVRADGGLDVINRGYSAELGIWKQAKGKAYFVKGPGTGFLKVSFFGPFYGSYVIFELDREKYQYALVCGPNKSYLWILARNPKLDEEVKAQLVAKAAAAGFDTDKLIFVDQELSVNGY